LVKHCVSVVLILSSDVEQLAISTAEEQGSLVQVGREESVSALEPQFIRQEGIGVEIAGAKEDSIDVSAASVFEGNRVSIDRGQQGTLLDLGRPVVAHRLGPPRADDVFGAVFDALKRDVLGGIGGADEKKSFPFELVRVAEVVSVHHATGELFDSGEGGDVWGGIMAGSDDDVGEALCGQHDIFLEILGNDCKVIRVFVVDARLDWMSKLHESSDIVL